MKKYKLSTLLKLCLIIIGCIAFITACQNADIVDTNQMGGGAITLRSFGPSPIQRGAELRIIGANMNQVQSVVLQGTAPITDIKRISNTEIRVMVPQDALPGVITIKSGSQEVTSLTPLTFNEPITITSITPLAVKAGDIIKIQGDYLNLIEEVIFTDGVHVLKADFKSQSRQAIEVAVPLKAQTGKIIVSNGADIIPDAGGNFGIPIWVYSDDELNVTLPAITKISPNPVRAGSLLTIEGTNFDLVDSVVFGGNVGTRNYVSKTATKIEVNVPANAADGHIKAIAFSGVPVLSSDSLVMVVPTVTSIDPNPVKNGATLTIKGKDLDLVSGVVFGGNKTGTIVAGGTATQIQVTVPIDATSGTVALSTKANKTVQTAVLNFVVPTIANITPTTIIAGDSLTITGTDLDLVSTINLGGNTTGVIGTHTATQIVVKTLAASTSGPVVMVTTNGTKITSTQTITINSANIPVITSMPASAKPGAMLSIVGDKLNLVQSVVFQDGVTATQYGSRTANLIEVYVPQDAKRGSVTLTLNTFDGKQVVSPTFTVTGTDPVVDPTLVLYDFDGKNADLWNGVGEFVNDGQGPSGNYYEVTAAKPSTGTWQFLFAENNRTHPSVSVSDHVLKIDVRLRNDLATPAGSWGLQLQFNLAGKVFNIESYLQVGSVLSTGGEWKTITIPLSTINGLPDPTPTTGGNWGMNSNQGSPFNDLVGLCIDNVRYEKVK